MLDSVIRVIKKDYPQTLLEECKYVIRKNKMENLINNDLSSSYWLAHFYVVFCTRSIRKA